ncbi:SRPBCC domain-containing protein [Haloferula sp. BvORR071]|uniref:SRPBCC family protein n=1 Tax=Haloferula sp. BvORR071 TaxID=1396141 RepID=UPI00054E9B7B|nr:SRPBCC domain-containing protein [Haloferula sp. BvORR071]
MNPTVSVTRQYPASSEEAFDAWLNPAKVGKWMFGPPLREEKVLRMGLEPKVGGRFSFVVEREGKEFDHAGKYLEIARPERLTFTWGVRGMSDESKSRVSLVFLPTAEGCELTLTHELDPEWADFAERTRAGWEKILDSLGRFLRQQG